MVCGMFGCTDHAQGVCADWCADCKSFLEVTPKRIAVIEAAKAFYEDKTMTAIEREAKLFGALLDLSAAEKGE